MAIQVLGRAFGRHIPKCSPGDFDQIFDAELREIDQRREAACALRSTAVTEPGDFALRQTLAGLALSGGGVRSATFCLGVLQAFVKAGIYREFDYLSTVSGGGYIGSTLTSSQIDQSVKTSKYVDPPIVQAQDASQEDEAEVVKHLRDYSRYLAPTGKSGSLNIVALVILGFSINILLTLPVLIWISFLIMATLSVGSIDNWPFIIVLSVLSWAAVYAVLVSRTKESDSSWASRPRWLRLTVFLLAFAALFMFMRVQPAAIEMMRELSTDVVAAALQWIIGSLGAFGVLFGIIGYILNRFGRGATKILRIGLGLIAPAILWMIVLTIVSTLTNPCSWNTFENFSGFKIVNYLRAFFENHTYINLRYPLGDCIDNKSLILVKSTDLYTVAVLYLVLSAALIALAWIVDVNSTSLHAFYRDRLREAFLWGLGKGGRPKLSELPAAGPYHILNAAINIQNSSQNLRGRNAKTFIFSKLFCGSDITGWCKTDNLEKADPQLDLAAAMAISGAAVAPNQGVATNRPLRFLMAIANARLGYWLINPARIISNKRVSRRVSPYFFLLELLGRLDEERARIYVSDGGHIENLGAYELLRRRCKYIVIVDAENDMRNFFHGLAHLVRIAKIDFNCEIDLSMQDLRRDESGLSLSHCALGSVHYASGQTGEILYIKASLTGDENEYIREYQTRFKDFPHESTTDQFFSEEQFEAYRALGFHIAQGLVGDHTEGIRALFDNLQDILFIDVVDKDAYLKVQARIGKIRRMEFKIEKESDETSSRRLVNRVMERKIQVMEFAVMKLRLNDNNISSARCRNITTVFMHWLADEYFRKFAEAALDEYGDDLRRFVHSCPRG